MMMTEQEHAAARERLKQIVAEHNRRGGTRGELEAALNADPWAQCAAFNREEVEEADQAYFDILRRDFGLVLPRDAA